jgi:FAD dependent oxidoreductase
MAWVVCTLTVSATIDRPAWPAAKSPNSSKGRPARSMTSNQHTFTVLDIQSISRESPEKAVKTFTVQKPSRTIRCDVLIAGGGIGGVAAAARIVKDNPKMTVCLTEETSWLGGQMTSQGVCALDENHLVETSGACSSYQDFRQAIRDFYKTTYKVTNESQSEVYFNPGNCWVTRLAFEPKVAIDLIEKMLAAPVSNGRLQIFRRHKIVRVESRSAGGPKALAVNLDNADSIEFKSKICLDATELGDLLPLAGISYASGSDSRSRTTEPHAPESGNPENVQDYVFPFVLDFRPGTDNSIAKPEQFDEFKSQEKFGFDGYKMFEDSVIEPEESSGKEAGKRTVPPFWTYRRLIDKDAFADPLYPFDVAMINWDSNDLRGYNIIDQPPEVQAKRLALAKSLSIGFLYWLQNDAPRDTGGSGYKELALRTDVLGTTDGLSMYPYIREARRVHAKTTIIEQDIIASRKPGARARLFDDTVGIGQYFVDIHGQQEIPGTGQATNPFQIPLGALIPEEGGQLLPACKNIGVTHITNGAYRLHPIEWAIGEAQGALASYCIEHKLAPADVLTTRKHLRALQMSLVQHGAPVFWFDDLPTKHPAFAAAQFAALTELLPIDHQSLHFFPDRKLTVGEAACSLVRLLALKQTVSAGTAGTTGSTADLEIVAIETCMQHDLLGRDEDWTPGRVLTNNLLAKISRHHGLLKHLLQEQDEELTRATFAVWLWAAATDKHFVD